MSTALGAESDTSAASLERVSSRRLISLYRQGGALHALQAIGRASEGAIARIDLGPFRPYLVTDPAHVQHVLRDRADNYERGAVMWKPVSRLVGNGISSEGPAWRSSREVLARVFSGQYIGRFTERMAEAINGAADDLLARAAREPVDVRREMNRLMHRAISLVFFDDRLPPEDIDRLGAAVSAASGSFMSRMAMPFMPNAVPMPGDRTFRRATRTVDEILRPLVAEGRRRPPGGHDVVSKLIEAHEADGSPFSDQRVRDDVVALFVSGTESTADGLTWLWVALDEHPQCAARVYEEIEREVGDGPAGPEHIRRLPYTQMFLQEVLRLHTVGWAVPRMAVHDDVIAGVPIKAGSTVVLSPYLTHRDRRIWESPEEFDPERFTPERVKERVQRHGRFAYFPFGAGDHVCLGEQLFRIETTLIMASLLSRARPVLHRSEPIEPQLTLTVRPSRPIEMMLAARS